jgi:hypothetical protein
VQVEKDFEKIAEFLHEALELAKSVQSSSGKLLKDFNKCATQYQVCMMLTPAVSRQHHLQPGCECCAG